MMQFSPPGELSSLCLGSTHLCVSGHGRVLCVECLAHCELVQLCCVLLEDEACPSSRDEVYFTVLNVMMILPRCGL